MADIVIPNKWQPMPHQVPLWRKMMNEGCLRAIAVWHRRAGKDSTALNITAAKAHERIGTYWHMLPEKEQARKAIWNGIDKNQRRIIDQVFPKEIRAKTVDDEMRIELINGSMWQVVGSDSYNSLVGSNPVGVTFSEYSVGNPAGWDYIRPILAENGGWAIFPYTPRGKNHGKTLFDMAVKNPDWFAQLLTVNDTMIIPPSVIQSERDSGMDDDMVEQEYFCSFEGVKQGSIYGAQMSAMRAGNRIGSFPYDRRYPVQTFWDIGHSDTTAIICHQEVGGYDRLLKAYEMAGEDIPHFVGWLKDTGFMFGAHYLPHDAKNVTLAAKGNPLGKNVWDQLYSCGLRDLKLVPRTPLVWTGINALRSRFNTLQIDETGCEGLISALESYHKKWDEARNTYLNEPVHDWSSNYADALRGWAQGYSGQGLGMRFSAPGVIQQSNAPGAPRLPARVQTVGSRRAGY